MLGRVLGLGIMVFSAIAVSTTVRAAEHHEIVITPESAVQTTRTLALPINKSETFRVNQTISKIVVGNGDIADAVAVSDKSFYVYGKKSGSTNISVFGENAHLLAVIDIIIGVDVAAVKRALYEALPHEKIAVRSVKDTFSLSGNVDSPAKVKQAMEIAKQFVDKDKTVINNLKVVGTQQVMLEVKIAEITRTLTKSLGFRPFLSAGQPGNPSGFSLSTLDPTNLSNFALAAGTAISGAFAITEMVDVLEQKGSAKILAEPNLVAMSGDTASFLAGGEFPIPVVQSSSGTVGTAVLAPVVTIQYQQFGISLAFTPTVIDNDLINVVVAPEVSQLDQQNAIVLQGFSIPALDVRRAKTTIELRDGQSFAIAGLISSNFNDTLRGIPGMMDIPFFGALLHNSNFTKDEDELVVIVTPRLVKPALRATLAAPTDSFVPPSDTGIFFYADPESPNSGIPANVSGGGLTGKYGHIIR